MKTIALVIAALAQGAGPSAGDDFCAVVRGMAAAAAEAQPFQSMRAEQTQFRLGRLACFFTAAGGYLCSHNLSRPDETRETYATRVAACLPGATRSTERRGIFEQITVRAGALEARFDERGRNHGHVGRTVTISFAAVRKGLSTDPKAASPLRLR